MHLSDRIVSPYHGENFLLVSNSFDLGNFKWTSQAEILTITDGPDGSLLWKEQVSTLKWDLIIQNHPIDEIQYFHRGIIQYSSSNIIQWIESKRRRGKMNDPSKLFFVHCQAHFPVTGDQPCCHGAAHRVHFLPQRGIFGPFLRASTFSNANKKRNKANLKDHEGRNPWSVKSDAGIICWCSCLVCFLPLVHLLRQQTIMADTNLPQR